MLAFLLSCSPAADTLTVKTDPPPALEDTAPDPQDTAPTDTGQLIDTDTGDPASTDLDGDGFAEDDCNDADPTIYPGAEEDCDGIDQDCDGEAETDADGDGWMPCEADCDDTDPERYPGADESTKDGADNDCDGFVDEDWSCMAEPGWLASDVVESITVSESGRTNAGQVYGAGFWCSAECTDPALTVTIGDSDACNSELASPPAVNDGAMGRFCVHAGAGSAGVSGDCTIEGGGEAITIRVRVQ